MTEMYPFKARGYYYLGLSYARKGEVYKADSLYKLGLERNPDNTNLLMNLATIRLQKKDNAKAQEYAEKAFNILSNDGRNSKEDGQINNILGVIYLNQSKFKEALPYFKNAVNSTGGKDWDVLHKYAVCLHNTGEHQEAIKYYSAALRLNPKDYQAMTNYGVALSHVGNGDAEKILRHSVTLNPNVEVTYSNLINHLIKVKKFNEIQVVVNAAKQNNVQIRKQLMTQLNSIGIQ